ncbi:Uncharacterised protein [Mycobacteroides abscessus subsp. massiliense]|uniref:hypothetical protein n=1 Tax=Mycobacteroides abscessus TaxID=36809 RepID=UPI0009A580E8|nr:hypothetical protein [Mycobacteroides abscessus]SKM82369.1 Uncharacterised protein [Mycobacteroides abscessus subsp. massiliense]SKM99080.1 Uncharacterised protein [Mycobacteroides abscessus subsp. massiliense]SKN77730.1 Uncharacterised protein [Mycobacteroides abscessus subsp. massiliense]SKN95538.1 Uncharacterised protein [Mycobacteroides abscessus subsp. massiliense]SKO22963.1 Uncharacterised protein [Mycobacteroides abscessus subsp. massiliense]
MTVTPYQPIAAAPRTAISQVTSVEQSRAVAEVQSAVIVAQQIPRDLNRAEAEMRDTCSRMAMAAQAFYQVPNRGTGPSVHLMRELARLWGNVQYGVNELHRDDVKAESEIQAWAWDVQTNTRATRTFIVPHARMARGRREELTDLGDITNNNNNAGARAVRECISAILPKWFTEMAQDLCRNTLENGEGVPLKDRIETMVSKFRQELGITQAQMEAKIGKKRGSWDAGDVAQMGITYTSITRDGMDKTEVFTSTAQLTEADITSRAAEPTKPTQKDPEAPSAGDLAPTSEHPEQGVGATEPAAEEVPAPDGVLSTPPPSGAATSDDPAAEVNSQGEYLATKKDLGTLRGLLGNAGYSLRTKEAAATTYAQIKTVINREISDLNDLSEDEATALLAADFPTQQKEN